MIVIDVVISCPHCIKPMKNRELVSGNTFGTKHYSDMRVISPMFPMFDDIKKCPECQKIFQVKEARVIEKPVGFLESITEKWTGTHRAQNLEPADYFSLLENNSAAPELDEISLRFRILWFYNDLAIQTSDYKPDQGTYQLRNENVRALAALLNENEPLQKIMKAELFRNLGEFDKSLEILQTVNDETKQGVVRQMIAECGKKNAEVFELKDLQSKS
jgi:hypothetical protein